MERHTQTLTMVHTSYIKTFILLIGITMSPLANAKNIISTSNFFHKNILHLKTNTLAQLNASSMSPLKIEDMVDLSSDFNLNLSDEDVAEICDNGIDDDGDGLVDCFDPDCSDFCITGNLSRSFVSSSTNNGFFSYDPDLNCASTDWEDDWTKFQSPEWFIMEEYDDGSFIMRGRLVNITDSNDSWEVWIRLHNKRSWAEWSALGRSFYASSAGGNCSANHTTWNYYETDETASRWYGTPGSINDGKVVSIGHNPTDFSKGVQVGFGANNCATCGCNSYNVRGWYNMSGDLDLPCGDYGSVMSGYETNNECNVYNGDFEDGLEFWDAKEGVTTTSDAASGSLAGVINQDNGTLSQILLPATQDYSYVASIWSKISATTSDAVLVMEFYDDSLNPLERFTTEVTNTAYQEYSFGGIAPPNSAYVSVWAWKGDGGSLYLDEFCLEISKNYTVSNCQDIQNGGFEDGTTDGWYTWGTVTITTAGHMGNYATLIYGGDGGVSQTLNVTGGEMYNFETYIRATNIDGRAAFGITWLDASDTPIYGFQQSLFTANFEKYSLLGRAPANAVKAYLVVRKTGGGEVYVDDNCYRIFERREPVEECNNGVDDDNDGLIDNEDDDCCPNLLAIPQANYVLHYVDSEQIGFGEAVNAFDGNPDTYWHTDFDNATYPLPHEIQIDLGSTHKIGGFIYQPVIIAADGRIKDYEIYVSDNPNSWGNAVATGTFNYDNLDAKEINFPLARGRYFRLVARSEVNNNGWTTAAEINILECKGQEICDNGIDDDGDGYIDNFDSDCPNYAPFLCDNALYQSLAPSEDYYNLYRINYNPVGFDSLANLTDNGLGINDFNAIAFNPVDRFIYGINPFPSTPDSYNLFRINALGEVANLGQISGMSGFKQAGAMGTNGEYYIYGFTDEFYKVDIKTMTATILSRLDFIVDDIAVSPEDGFIYGWSRSARSLVKIDPNTGVATEIGVANPDYQKFGSMMFNAQNEIIAYGNNISANTTQQESLVKIDPTTGVVTSLGNGPDTDKNDGCSCAFGIELTKTAQSTSVRRGDVFTYTFTIFNRTGTALNDINFNDILTDGFLWDSEPKNLTGLNIGTSSISGTTTADFIISNIPVGINGSFDIDVLVPDDYCGDYANQANITNIPSIYGDYIFSDDANTPAILDSTLVSVIACTEICDNGIDDDGDGRIDSDDAECDCPIIATSDSKNVAICNGEAVTFNIVTDASNVPFGEIELYSFSSPQFNPYTATGSDKRLIGRFDNDIGLGAINSREFPIKNGLKSTYYVYALLSPAPSDLGSCSPFLEYIISVDPCQEVEIDCAEGRTIENYFSGIQNNIPKTLSFSDEEDIDSVLVQIVYEDESPGTTISITDNDGIVHNFQRMIQGDIHLYQGVIPPTSGITYTNQLNQETAQSIIAYVYKSNQPGGTYSRYSVAVSGHRNTRNIDFPLPNRNQIQDVTLKLPLSELTYDDRVLNFKVTAGTITETFTKQWGLSGDNFPGSCCLDFVEITLSDLPTTVANINVEINSPTPTGQSYIIAGTVFLELDCYEDEDCGDGIDNDNDGDIDLLDLDCSGYCSNNGTFLPYGMLPLENFSGLTGLYSEQYDLTFDINNTAYLFWTSGNEFTLSGTAIAYQDGNYVGLYTLNYTARGVGYATFEGDDILGSTSGSGSLVSNEPSSTLHDVILLDAKLNSNGVGLRVRAYGEEDIRLEGDWGLASWDNKNTINLKVVNLECQAPKEICGNGKDDDRDGLIDCADSDCTNPMNGGTIAGNESNCGLYTPTIITVQSAPNGGGNGIPSYQWERSTDNINWKDINGAIQATYSPTLITQTTSYRRKTSMGNCNPWLFSNIVTKTVTPSTFDAEIINAPSGINGYLCDSESYVFQAASIDDVVYVWEFGTYARPSTAVGAGPHNVVFNTPTDSLPISTEVVLNVLGTSGALCVSTDTLPVNLRPLSYVVAIDFEDPSLCGANDGRITLTTDGEINPCIEVSLDGGLNYQPEGQVTFANLPAGSYEIVTRYCDNGCPNIAEIINLSDPATISLVNDDFRNICPGFNYSGNVFINDAIEGETTLSLASDGNLGTVALEDNGDFVYTPHTLTCDMDQFAYTVCDLGMNCCVTAVVTIDFNDEEAPMLINVPVDLTVNCDEEIPLPPLVTASDNCPAISIDRRDFSTQGEEGCALYDYTVTYTWIAQDFCGNEAIDSQQVFVKDQTAPDIYRIYTMPNGKRMVAGVMENVTHRWKVVQLPLEFNTRPLIFSQLTTVNEASTATVRLRNISANQFEVKLQEEAANDNQRTGESVAWFAIEAGTELGDYQLEAGLFSVGDAVRNITFQNGFTQTPAFFANMQSISDEDPAYPRSNNLSNTGVSVNIQEESSLDNDISHNQERLAYLAVDNGVLNDRAGDVLGEAESLTVDDAWQTIELSNTYINPVVVATISSLNESDPAVVQVNNVTAESFDVRIKEWDYLDGKHALETVNYIVIEGSIPLSSEKFCEFGTDSLVLGVDIVAIDNCDQNVTISYEEMENISGPRQIFSRVWSAVDECGNKTLYTQDVACEGVYVQIKAMLQGATIFANDGMMRDDLRRKGLIPLTEPYSANPNFKHVGGGGETMDESMMNDTGKNACVDWVFIELCDGNDINNVVATQSAVIQRDGDVMTALGDSLIRFENVPPGNYFVALSHRNHLKTVSLQPYTFTPSTIPMVNFINDFTPVIGIEPNIDLGAGQRALWSGDLNGDDRIIYQGPQNDVFDMFLHVILDSINAQFLTNFISVGYTNNDFNMDGTVIFQGPNNDKSAMLFNTTLRHPNNPENFSNFIIATHIDAQIAASSNRGGAIPDDDNDRVTNENDIEAKDKNSDSDGAGITDNIETGGAGKYDYLIDTDPLNPCSPIISSLCVGIDADGDGFFRNYPTTHAQYDAADENPCLPDFNKPNCSCTDNFIDNDNEVLVKICHQQANGRFETIQVPLSTLTLHLEHGDICGPCNN